MHQHTEHVCSLPVLQPLFSILELSTRLWWTDKNDTPLKFTCEKLTKLKSWHKNSMYSMFFLPSQYKDKIHRYGLFSYNLMIYFFLLNIKWQSCCNRPASQLHTRVIALLKAWVSSRFSVKCTPEAISSRSAGSDLPQRKRGLQEKTRLDRQTLPESFHTYSGHKDTWVNKLTQIPGILATFHWP